MQKSDLEGAPFVVKTFSMVSDISNKDCVSWSAEKDSFVVHKPVEFSAEVLPKYFKHNNFCSFIRQLNTYGFHKVETQNKQWEFKNEFFKDGDPEALKKIIRRKSKKRENEKDDEIHLNMNPPPLYIGSNATNGSSSLAQQVQMAPPQAPQVVPQQAMLDTSNSYKDPNEISCNFSLSSEDTIFALMKNIQQKYSEQQDEIYKLKSANVVMSKELIRLQGMTSQMATELLQTKRANQMLQEHLVKLTHEVRHTQVTNGVQDISLQSIAQQPIEPRPERSRFDLGTFMWSGHNWNVDPSNIQLPAYMRADNSPSSNSNPSSSPVDSPSDTFSQNQKKMNTSVANPVMGYATPGSSFIDDPILSEMLKEQKLTENGAVPFEIFQ